MDFDVNFFMIMGVVDVVGKFVDVLVERVVVV